MEKNEQQSLANKIRSRYMEKEAAELDSLRELDAKVKRPVNVFSYIFGGIGAVVMGIGMSLVMTEIGTTVGIANSMTVGIIIGVVGLLMSLVNYPVYKKLMNRRKERYGAQITALCDEIINKEDNNEELR